MARRRRTSDERNATAIRRLLAVTTAWALAGGLALAGIQAPAARAGAHATTASKGRSVRPASERWQQIGPFGGFVEDLAIAPPPNSSQVFAIVDDNVRGHFVADPRRGA